MSEKKLLVKKIKEGTVIDHIKAGNGAKVLELLDVSPNHNKTTILLTNVRSGKLGRKDILKIKGKEISGKEVNKIALLAPNATLNIIRDFDVVKKKKVKLPEEFKGIIDCPNPDCITQNEKENIKTKFELKSRKPLKLSCHYCERTFRLPELL